MDGYVCRYVLDGRICKKDKYVWMDMYVGMYVWMDAWMDVCMYGYVCMYVGM